MPAIQLTSKRNQRDFAWPIASLLDEDEPTWSRIREAVAASAADPAPVYLVGGEPTLRRDCGALLAQLGAGFPERELVLLTNGRSFFYERVCDALPPVDAARLAVEVWITSTRRDVHEATVSVSESLDQADRGIRQLLARGRRTRVRLLVGRQNHTTLPEAAAQLADRYPEAECVIWDVATLCHPATALQASLAEAASYLESAITLQRARGMATVVDGMPACLLRPEHRPYRGGFFSGTYRDECAACRERAHCPGVPAAALVDRTLQLEPLGPSDEATAVTTYAAYLTGFLAHYTPPELRHARAVLDAMCGRDLPNLEILRRFFADAELVHGADINLTGIEPPPGTALSCVDLCASAARDARYDYITVFKPPGDAEFPIARALATLLGLLRSGGALVIALAEHTDVDPVLAALAALHATVEISEPNALRASIEPEHKWVIACRARDSHA